jgi:predicted nucleic acid-binding protein
MFVLDTNVVSELRKISAGKADRHVALWADEVDPDSLHISAITVLELEVGVLQIERRDPAQGGMLRAWLETRVLPESTSGSCRSIRRSLAAARACTFQTLGPGARP